MSTSSHGLGGCHEPDRTRPAGATDQRANPHHHRSGAARVIGIKHVKVRDAIAPPPRLLSLAVLVKQAADQYRAMSDVGPPRRHPGLIQHRQARQTGTRSQQVKPLRCSASPLRRSGGGRRVERVRHVILSLLLGDSLAIWSGLASLGGPPGCPCSLR